MDKKSKLPEESRYTNSEEPEFIEVDDDYYEKCAKVAADYMSRIAIERMEAGPYLNAKLRKQRRIIRLLILAIAALGIGILVIFNVL